MLVSALRWVSITLIALSQVMAPVHARAVSMVLGLVLPGHLAEG